MKIIREKSILNYTDDEIAFIKEYKADFEKKLKKLQFVVNRIMGREGKLVIVWDTQSRFDATQEKITVTLANSDPCSVFELSQYIDLAEKAIEVVEDFCKRNNVERY